MKNLLIILLVACSFAVQSQTVIHSHNDYEKPEPLVNGIRNRVFSVEADVFPIGEKLFVSHHKATIDSSKNLSNLYIEPIVALFQKNKHRISEDASYKLTLVIDVKENWPKAIELITNSVKPYQKYFDRSMNKNAVQIIISGDRGNIADWTTYPSYIYFDGRPYENYNTAQVKKLGMISDNYANYITKSDPTNTDSLTKAINKTHQMGKPIRFWNTPDKEETWQKLRSLKVDIINTDKVQECAGFLKGNIKT